MIPEFKQWQECMKTDSFSKCTPLFKIYIEKKRSICRGRDPWDSKCTTDPAKPHQKGHPSSYGL